MNKMFKKMRRYKKKRCIKCCHCKCVVVLFLRVCRLLTVNWERSGSLASDRPKCLMGIVEFSMETAAGTEGRANPIGG